MTIVSPPRTQILNSGGLIGSARKPRYASFMTANVHVCPPQFTGLPLIAYSLKSFAWNSVSIRHKRDVYKREIRIKGNIITLVLSPTQLVQRHFVWLKSGTQSLSFYGSFRDSGFSPNTQLMLSWVSDALKCSPKPAKKAHSPSKMLFLSWCFLKVSESGLRRGRRATVLSS